MHAYILKKLAQNNSILWSAGYFVHIVKYKQELNGHVNFFLGLVLLGMLNSILNLHGHTSQRCAYSVCFRPRMPVNGVKFHSGFLFRVMTV